jgi:hypothetical protein
MSDQESRFTTKRERLTKKVGGFYSRFDWFVATLLPVMRDVMDWFQRRGNHDQAVR